MGRISVFREDAQKYTGNDVSVLAVFGSMGKVKAHSHNTDLSE
jgi:hypothetical protein